MKKYIVKDWACNVMNWGEFECDSDALDAIYTKVNEEMEADGYDALDEKNEHVYNTYCDEYFVDEIDLDA